MGKYKVSQANIKKHRKFTKDWCGVNLRNDLTIH